MVEKIIDVEENKKDKNWEQKLVEKLATASLREQRAKRRWRNFFSLAWVGVVLTYGYFIFIDNPLKTEDVKVSKEHTAIVKINGVISATTEANAKSINSSMEKALKNENSRALVLLIDSPGGSVVQSGLIHDEIYRLKEIYKKPVYAVIEEMGASGGYYIATASDKIFANEASLVGSIGVILGTFGFTEAMEKLGVERRLIVTGENKAILDPFSSMTENQKEHLQEMVEDIQQQFIGVVRKGRGKKLKETPEMFSGLFWTGQKAVELGLVDEIASLDKVARDIIQFENIVDYSRKENPLDKIIKQFGMSIGNSLAVNLKNQNFDFDLR